MSKSVNMPQVVNVDVLVCKFFVEVLIHIICMS